MAAVEKKKKGLKAEFFWADHGWFGFYFGFLGAAKLILSRSWVITGKGAHGAPPKVYVRWIFVGGC